MSALLTFQDPIGIESTIERNIMAETALLSAINGNARKDETNGGWI